MRTILAALGPHDQDDGTIDHDMVMVLMMKKKKATCDNDDDI